MAATFADVRNQQDQVSIPTIWLAVAISIVLHTLLLWSWPSLLPTELLSPNNDELLGKKQGSLAVRIARLPPPAAAQAPSPPAPHVKRPPQPHAASSVAAAPPVLTRTAPSPATSPSTAPPAAAPKPAAAPPTGGDFASFVEQRRRQREQEESPADEAPAETEQERHNREVARSLGLNRGQGLGATREHGGGIFQIMSINDRNATVAFYGWNKTIERKVLQTIEVSRGDQPTIELAVVRRMIEIIRTQAPGHFTWESIRLKRDVELSSRQADQRELEDFLMAEFFAVEKPAKR